MNNLLDARDLIKTNNEFRKAKVDWEATIFAIGNQVKDGSYITQGFWVVLQKILQLHWVEREVILQLQF